MAQRNIVKTIAKLAAVVVAMFAFVFVVMVPMYNIVCQAYGLNGKSSSKQYQVPDAGVDKRRSVTVQYIAANAQGMPWEFRPLEASIVVHPGALNTVEYYAKNGTDKDMVSQSVPSFVPSRAARYIHTTKCFCFRHQPLKAGVETKLAVQFIVDRELPADISNIALSYTIFDVTAMDKTGKRIANR